MLVLRTTTCMSIYLLKIWFHNGWRVLYSYRSMKKLSSGTRLAYKSEHSRTLTRVSWEMLNLDTIYRVSNYRVCLLYALVCKGCAYHILFSHIIIKIRHETNCWSWFWVYKSDQKWKILKNTKKNFFCCFFGNYA